MPYLFSEPVGSGSRNRFSDQQHLFLNQSALYTVRVNVDLGSFVPDIFCVRVSVRTGLCVSLWATKIVKSRWTRSVLSPL